MVRNGERRSNVNGERSRAPTSTVVYKPDQMDSTLILTEGETAKDDETPAEKDKDRSCSTRDPICEMLDTLEATYHQAQAAWHQRHARFPGCLPSSRFPSCLEMDIEMSDKRDKRVGDSGKLIHFTQLIFRSARSPPLAPYFYSTT